MKAKSNFMGISFNRLISFLFPLLLFWLILFIKVPYSFSQYFHIYSLGLFLAVIALYFLSFSFRGRAGVLLSLGLTMALFSLSLSYMWTSGFSDNFIIGGLLPYKDAKNYYFGANLLLNGFPMLNAGQATERPLFPGFLATLLLLTGQNLKITLAIITQLGGVGLYFSARQIRNSFGWITASLFATLLYFYIQHWVGYSLSELLGFMAGCWGFTMIWLASSHRRKADLIVGVAILLVAVSARAGAFLIFPMLVLWAGWVFRAEKRYSLKAAVYALVVTVALYLLINSVYSRFLGIPPGYSFGNFSYMIYGQVRGGTGWHSAIAELGTRNPAFVYRAAWDFFLKHPISLFIGFAKSYRDFFKFGDSGIFPFSGSEGQYIPNIILWLGMLILLLWGIIQLCKNIRSNLASLLLAGFVGIFLSIPFLPPVDGGSRFYASTMPFFFAPLVVGAGSLSKSIQEAIPSADDASTGDLIISRYASAILLATVIIAPILIHIFSQEPVDAAMACPAKQRSFLIQSYPASYVDLVKDHSAQCGKIPQVCLNDFERNNLELVNDDYYRSLISLAKNDNTNIRIVPAINLTENTFHYYYIPLDQLSNHDWSGLLAGCAVEIKTMDQSIFQVKSVFPNGN